MTDDVQRALDIDASSTVEDRTIDITSTGRRTGRPRRIEIGFYRLGADLYLRCIAVAVAVAVAVAPEQNGTWT